MIAKLKKRVGEQEISSDHIINFSGQITKKLPSQIMVIYHKTWIIITSVIIILIILRIIITRVIIIIASFIIIIIINFKIFLQQSVRHDT